MTVVKRVGSAVGLGPLPAAPARFGAVIGTVAK